MTQGAGQGYEPGSGYEPTPGYGYRAAYDAAPYEGEVTTYDPGTGTGTGTGTYEAHAVPYEADTAGFDTEPATYDAESVSYDAAPAAAAYETRTQPVSYDADARAYDAEPVTYAPAPAAYEPTRPDTPLVPSDYTPTAQNLPVITSGTEPGSRPGPLYVVGDVHGYLDELQAALRECGLLDEEGHWSAGSARLWFLGDFTDRGPDGIGVIELVMQLSAEAAAAGGYCRALMGNHELLLLGAHHFGDTPVNSTGGTASFLAAWRLNGGQPSDMERLEDRHLTWISRLDAAHLTDGHLLLHSDTTAYLDYGSSIEEMNDTVTGVLQRGDADECWDLFRKFTKRFAFRGDGGAEAARELLAAYGGHRVVHGHSPIPYLVGDIGGSGGSGGENPADGEEHGLAVDGPMLYAENLAVAMDGGVTMEGRLLVAQLPLAS